jgi:thiol-disulfide isomerase/thioredoxin
MFRKIILLALVVSVAALAQVPPQSKPQRKPPTLYRVQSGDLDGDRRSELITWDSESKEIAVKTYVAGQWKQLTAHTLENFPNLMKVADLDGDGKGELIIGEGLRGYNPKTGPQTDIHLRIYRPLDKDGWTPEEIFRQPSERPEIASLEIVDTGGGKRPEILFAYFAEKYQVDIRVARRAGGAWKIEELPRVRMGMHVVAGDVLRNGRKMIVVGRPYGEAVTALGDAFVMDGAARIDLPVFRGVSSVAIGDVDGDRRPEIVVADGWHADYGKIARARLAVIKRVAGKWNYQLIEDVPEHIRLSRIVLADMDGDGRAEIIAHGERRGSLGGDVRVYQRTAAGWRGMTVAKDAQDFALGSFTARGKQELVFSGPEIEPVALDLRHARWDSALAGEVETYKIDPATLVDKLAPRLQAEEWIGSEPLALDKLKGKVVLLDFWATWCKPCIDQFPIMRQWQEKFGPNGLVIIGMTDHSSQTSEEVRAFVAKWKLPWAVAIDARSRTQMDFGVSPIPHTFLIDRLGILRMSHVGGTDLPSIEPRIEALLAHP